MELRDKGPDQEWRGNVKQIRKQKLDWIMNNLNVKGHDPYNPAQMTELTNTMIRSGVIHKSNNISMLIRSTETLVIEARRLQGYK